MRPTGTLVAALCLAASSSAAAQSTVLRFHAVVDGSGHAIPNGVIVVDSDRITRVSGPSEAVPVGAKVIDLTRYTAIPGLVDVHTHMTYYWDPASGTNPWRQPQRTP
ncbi:MAG TPA: hypothetical protein VFS57_01105, partial [Gemmatimonadaceae bacterium]|nr:hypothetical protein [Gemmatimonadaceae bacterium]